MTRKSKIARLPRSIRDELNQRLDNGQPGIRLVEWLNGLSEVKEILARDFQASRITPQNLSEWKRGGYHDWVAQHECRASLQDWLADAKELGEAASPEKMTEAMLTCVTVHYAAAMHDCDYRPESREKLRLWSPILNDVIRLHNCDLARQRLELDEQRMELNRQRLDFDHARLELARQRVELDRQRLEPPRREARATVNPEGVPSFSPGLRREAGRYPGESSQRDPSNPERVASETAPDPHTDPESAQHATRNTEQRPSPPADNPAKTPLEINALQPNPTKSNNSFFIFFQPATVGQASHLSPSTLTLGSITILPKYSRGVSPGPTVPPPQDKLPADPNSGNLAATIT